jgi:tricorn protease
MRKVACLLCLLVGTVATAPAQPSAPRQLYGEVAVGADVIVFTLHDRLWEVPLHGGDARALPIGGGELRFPVLSPDGRRIAFSQAGALWVYDRPSGALRRLTWHPRLSIPRAWSSDGQRILFTAARDGVGSTRAYEVAAAGGVERRLPFYPVRFAAYEPGGNRLAIVGRSHFALGIDRRFYRGGNRDPLLLVREGDRKAVEATTGSTNLVQPMWLPQGLFVLTDSLGSFNLAQIDPAKRRLKLLTHFRRDGVTAAAASREAIVLVRDGTLLRVDPATGRAHEVEVRLPAIPDESPRQVSLLRQTAALTLGPAGRLVAIEARGDVFTIDVNRQALARLTSTPGAAERGPVIAPDGSRIAYFSDSGGEYALVIARLRDGQRERRFALASSPTFSRELVWSPNGRRLAFSDLRLRLWTADLATGVVEVADTARWVAQGLWQVQWSPDSRVLAYAKADETGLRSIWLRDIARRERRRLSASGTDDTWPVFSPDGRTLYYASSVLAGNAYAREVWALESDLSQQANVSSRLVALEWGDVGATPRPLPLGARSVLQLWSRPDGRLLMQAALAPPDGSPRRGSSELLEVQPASGSARRLADGVRGVEMSSDGRAALLSRGDGLSVLTLDSLSDAAPAAPKALALAEFRFEVNPAAERPQLFDEAMRLMRDVFYDPALHGESWSRLRTHYAEYLPGLRARAELNELLIRAFGEVSVSHLDVFGGELQRAPGDTAPAGLLGVDVDVSQGRFRIARVYAPSRSVIPGLDVAGPSADAANELRAGEYILSVNGADVKADRPFEAHFVGMANRSITVRVAREPAGEGGREVRVRPLEDDGDLRRRAWAEANARFVTARSRGRIAYVYIPEWSEGGLAEFYRVFNSLREGQGLIIDQRWNTGGITPDGVIAALARRPLLAYHFRYGAELPIPLHRATGPTALLINEGNGSAAETFALMFRREQLGPIIGRQTGGGGIGASLFSPRLIDGGRVAIPNRGAYDPATRQWTIENAGIAPDIRADWPVVEASDAGDPQLLEAIASVQRRLTGDARRRESSPPAPVHPRRDP